MDLRRLGDWGDKKLQHDAWAASGEVSVQEAATGKAIWVCRVPGMIS